MKIYFYIVYKVKITGNTNFDPKGQYMVIGNHIHILDPVVISSFSKLPIHWMAKKELFKYKFFNPFIRLIGAFPVDREAKDIVALKTTLALLTGGKNVGIFPEGTRNKQLKELPAKSGALQLARKTNVNILPITIDSTYRFRSELHIHFHDVIDMKNQTKDMTPEMIEEKAQELMKQIYSECKILTLNK